MRSETQANLRRETMLRMLDKGENISVQEFKNVLNCSYATLRNDLAYLEKKGMVLRTHGGAVRTDVSPVIGRIRRENAQQDEKQAIAKKVFDTYIRANMTLILDAGTTNVEIARVIAASDLPLTVLTHSEPVIHLLAEAEQVQLFALGGSYKHDSRAFYDRNIRKSTEAMHADLYFMGFNGILPDQGFAHAIYLEQDTKMSYMAIASKTIAVGASTKLDQSGLWISGTFSEIQSLVTDSGIRPELYQKLSEVGLEVLIAEDKKE